MYLMHGAVIISISAILTSFAQRASVDRRGSEDTRNWHPGCHEGVTENVAGCGWGARAHVGPRCARAETSSGSGWCFAQEPDCDQVPDWTFPVSEHGGHYVAVDQPHGSSGPQFLKESTEGSLRIRHSRAV